MDSICGFRHKTNKSTIQFYASVQPNRIAVNHTTFSIQTFSVFLTLFPAKLGMNYIMWILFMQNGKVLINYANFAERYLWSHATKSNFLVTDFILKILYSAKRIRYIMTRPDKILVQLAVWLEYICIYKHTRFEISTFNRIWFLNDIHKSCW